VTASPWRHLVGPIAAALLAAGCTSSADPEGWIDAGSVDRVVTAGVVHLGAPGVFVVAVEDGFLGLLDDAKHLEGERVVYCESSDGFESRFHGEQFDRHGRYRVGPAHSDMDRVEVRVRHGRVEVNPTRVTRFLPGERSSDATPPAGPPCLGDERSPGGRYDVP
jgi:nitrite reductase/ring-hydroxylating ferredoxin subunit